MKYYLMHSDELYHHGIKGQKWGIRRFQNEDGSVTNQGAVRYYVYDGKWPFKSGQRSGVLKKASNQSNNSSAEDKNIKSEKQKLNIDRTSKVLFAIGAGALGVSAGYGMYRYVNANLDSVIKAGTNIQRITTSESDQVHDLFYASVNAHDNKRYEGYYGKQIKTRDFLSQVYKKQMTSSKDIKVAGLKNAEKAYKELIERDPEFKKLIQNNRIDSYNQFNTYAIAAKSDNTNMYKKYFDYLGSKGYNGVVDINDVKNSGYNTDKPIIFFDVSKDIKVNKVEKLDYAHINDAYAKELQKVGIEAVASLPPQIMALPLLAGASRVVQTNNKSDVSKNKDYSKQNKVLKT